MKIFTTILIVVLALTAVSCIKDDLTQPSDLSFLFELVSDDAKISDALHTELKSSSLNEVREGVLVINAVEFDGRRAAGRDVSFISAFPSVVTADLVRRKSDYPVDFNIPQGIYNRIDISLHLDAVERFAFMVEGTVKAGPLSSVPFRFEFGFPDMITVRATPSQGVDIVLRRDKPSVARVKIDVGFMFRFVNPGSIASADITNIGGVNWVIINSENNIALFNQIAARFNNSVRVVFE